MLRRSRDTQDGVEIDDGNKSSSFFSERTEFCKYIFMITRALCSDLSERLLSGAQNILETTKETALVPVSSALPAWANRRVANILQSHAP
jgi:hypothetical protein